MCLLITTNTRQLGTGNSSSSSRRQLLLSASWLVGLKKPDIYFQHHGFTKHLCPYCRRLSLRIRYTSYCVDDGSHGNLNIYYIIYIYIVMSLLIVRIRNFHLLMFRPSSLSLKPVALSLRQIRPTPRAIYHLRMSSTSATDMTPRLGNVLAKSKSPYLLQHKDNPVAVGSFRFLHEVLRLTK